MERFWSKVEKDVSGCWLWTAYKNKSGYGVFNRGDKKTVMSHRMSWEFENGPIPDGMHILHTCDNPACVNPDHLWLGTHSDNMQDMARKGRWGKPRVRGERHGRAKLTNEAVKKVKLMAAVGINQRVIAEIVGISQAGVSLVSLGKTYTHVTVSEDDIERAKDYIFALPV